MNKQEFILDLKQKLQGLPKEDIERSLEFYSELIDDKVEDGISEENAVSEIGEIDDIVLKIISEIPLKKLVKEKLAPKRTLSAWQIMLIALGSPIWLSLFIAVFAVILSMYVSLWAVIIFLWAVEICFIACILGCIAMFVLFVTNGLTPTGIAALGISIFLAGFSVFFFFGCKLATKAIAILTKKIFLGIKARFLRKENVK